MTNLERLSERIQTYFTQLDILVETTHDSISLLKYGSTVVMVSLFEHDEETYCRISTLMLSDFEPNLEMLQRILRLNTEVLFGSLIMFEDNTLSFSATLHGNHLTFDEFSKTLRYAAKISDKYGEELQLVGGGLRADELLHSANERGDP